MGNYCCGYFKHIDYEEVEDCDIVYDEPIQPYHISYDEDYPLGKKTFY